MRKLPVPENIPLTWQLWRGFGKPELIRTVIITAVVLVGGVAFCAFSTWPPRKIAVTVAVIFTLFFCSGLFGRMDGNQSIYDFIRRGRRYRREQQTYWYKVKKDMVFYVSKEHEA